MRTHNNLNGGTVQRIAKMRRYRDEWNAKQASGDRRYSCRSRLADGMAGILQARSHGIGKIGTNSHGPTFSECGNYASIPSDVLDGLRDCGTVPDILGNRYGGWYADAFEDETYTGQVWQIPSRNGESVYISGYVERDSGYAVLNASRGLIETFCSDPGEDSYDKPDALREAARAADGLAERNAERDREYSERWQEASRHDSERESAREDLRDGRLSARSAIRAIRELRATVKDCDAVEETRVIVIMQYRKARNLMRRAIATIERETAAIAELGMQGEF